VLNGVMMININTKITKILLIEDDLISQKIICKLLASKNFIVITASDGEKGLQLAQELIPDLIISDVNIPKMNGYEILKSIRKNQDTASTPFIFLTGEVATNYSHSGMEQDTNVYLTEPVIFNSLLKTISHLLLTKESYQQDIPKHLQTILF
jgi:two-component system, sensor histidine kinase and response regulator